MRYSIKNHMKKANTINLMRVILFYKKPCLLLGSDLIIVKIVLNLRIKKEIIL